MNCVIYKGIQFPISKLLHSQSAATSLSTLSSVSTKSTYLSRALTLSRYPLNSVLNRPGRSSGRLKPGLYVVVRAGLKPSGAPGPWLPPPGLDWTGLACIAQAMQVRPRQFRLRPGNSDFVQAIQALPKPFRPPRRFSTPPPWPIDTIRIVNQAAYSVAQTGPSHMLRPPGLACWEHCH